MTIEKLSPTCNLDTIRDGRGGIFTFYPEDPIVEISARRLKSEILDTPDSEVEKFRRFHNVLGNIRSSS